MFNNSFSIYYIRFIIFLLAVSIFGFSTAFAKQERSQSKSPMSESFDTHSAARKFINIGAGFRYSSYGVNQMPENDYWIKTGKFISSKLTGSMPEAIWIVGEITPDNGVSLNFPCTSKNPLIESTQTDRNEKVFDQFDKEGFKIWLQVEPGDVDVIELINIILSRYKHHPCIAGFGVDVEWYKISRHEDGKALSNDEAREWVTEIKQHNRNYNLFLKHWLIEKMPSSERSGITFINDGQEFNSMKDMVEFFAVWANNFYPSKVGFQFGYPADKKWWGNFADPFKTISRNILLRAHNISSVFWVDFTILDVFPPKQN
jgi:hypothetical protein